ncbi:lamin tail domain-containing protein [Halobaculum litoreum]|uniref:Lamin tail domain-containing protein n=1 Tax=Halobaculum litoreum TaxID=3031998 RepID=A0ABD5XRF5_9EURY
MNATRGRTLALVVLVVLAGCLGGSAPAGEGATTAGTADATTDPTERADTTAVDAEGTLEVHFINVGQADSTLVIGPSGETMLIDTGHFTDDGEVVLSYLRAHDAERIDHLVTTHADADHIGGNADIIEYYETEADGIGAVYDPGIASTSQTYEEYLDAVERHNVTLYLTQEGDEIPMPGVDADVLSPPNPYLAGEDRNENSIVLTLVFGATGVLLTGDAEGEAEEHLVETYGETLETTVLKAGHHGSAGSTGGPLLDAASAEAVVISSAYDSRYGHPHPETLDRFAERSLTTFWTATHGTVVLTSDGETVEVATQRAAPTDPDRLREGSAIEPENDAPVERRYTITPDGASAADAATTEPTATATATDGGTDTPDDGGAADGSLAIATVHADAAGDDNDNLNDEYVTFENVGESTLDLSGWTVADAADHVYTVPDGTTLAPGEQVTLYTGSGTDTAGELYWGSGSAIWNNGGDTVVVRDADGTVVLEEAYS